MRTYALFLIFNLYFLNIYANGRTPLITDPPDIVNDSILTTLFWLVMVFIILVTITFFSNDFNRKLRQLTKRKMPFKRTKTKSKKTA